MSPDETLDLALKHYASGRLRDTEGLLREILGANPRHGPALHLLGVLAYRTGHHDAAIDLMRRAIAENARVAEYYSNLGVVLTAVGRFDEAVSACQQAQALDPDLAEVHHNLGNALRDAGRGGDAMAAYRRAVAIRFDYPEAHNNLGSVARDRGELEVAIASYRQAVQLRPDYAAARSNLGNALKEVGLQREAIDEHCRAVALAPEAAEVHSNLILSLHYDADTDAPSIDNEARQWNQRHGAPYTAAARAHDNDRNPDRPLRVGFVSGDFRTHSVASFLLPWFEARDRARCHYVCYATGGRADPVTARLRAASDEWRSLAGVPDDAAAERIRGDRIDILVDLCGHTAGNRLTLFARKPAPIEVSYLGFVGTTGLSAIDYRLTDAIADPPGADDGGTEKLARLPHGVWCFAPLVDAPAVTELPALRGGPGPGPVTGSVTRSVTGSVTFASFNNLAKVTPYTLKLWARVLQQVPGSRLLLKSAAFRGAETRRRFEDFYADRGIVLDRLELIADEPSPFLHLQHYGRVDIALDTFPYNGVTTTCEALWMGVPVVTLAGRRHASRIGASLLSSAGYPDQIAATPDAFVQCAAKLAGDLPRLAALRAAMRERLAGSALMDAKAFAASFEDALRAMWQRWCARSAR
jgi:predicted O-linked N-acetylglucosamine transferase (SPINDLY family)